MTNSQIILLLAIASAFVMLFRLARQYHEYLRSVHERNQIVRERRERRRKEREQRQLLRQQQREEMLHRGADRALHRDAAQGSPANPSSPS